MGRELRRVPPKWEHPQEEKYDIIRHRSEQRYKPLYDHSCEGAWDEWQQEFQEWKDGEGARIAGKYGEDNYPKDRPYTAFCQWHGTPPSPEYYRPHWPEGEATWWQVYETVSEGTPVSPPFETQDELINYLVESGDFWDQKRREEGCTTMNCKPWERKHAEKFVLGTGWAPSFVADSSGIKSGVEFMGESGK